MKKIYDIHKINTNDKLYCKEQKENCVIYHIFKPGDVIIQNDIINLKTINCFSFMVPNNSSLKAFLYDSYTNISIKKTDSLYKLSESEYLDTYLVFLKNDGNNVSDLPAKLIQDL